MKAFTKKPFDLTYLVIQPCFVAKWWFFKL